MIGYRGSPARGTGGAGIGGFLSGIQEAQQFGANRQNMEAKDQEMGFLKKQFSDQQDKMVVKDYNEAYYTAQETGNYDIVNKMLNENQLLGGGQFGTSDATGYKPDGSMDFGLINRVTSETGEDYTLGDKLRTFTDAEGNQQFVGKNSYANGSPTYRSFKEGKDNANMLMQAKIAKANQVKGEKFDKAKTQYDAKVNVSKLTNDEEFKENWKALKEGGPLNEEYYSKLQELESVSENQFKDAPLDATLTGLADMNQAYSDVNDMYQKDGFNSGITKSMASDIAKLGADDSKLTPSEQMKQFNTIIMKSKLGGAMSRYLKAISGSAVTEEEFLRTMKNAVGGDLSKVNAQTIMTAMKSTIDSMGKTTQEQIDGIQPGTPAAKMWRQSRYNKAMNPTASNQPFIKRPTSGTQSIEQRGVEAVGEEVKALTDFGGSALKEGASIITEPIVEGAKSFGNSLKSYLQENNILGKDDESGNDAEAVYSLANNITEQVKNLGKVGEVKLNDILTRIGNKTLSEGDAMKELSKFLGDQPSSFGR